MMLNELDIRRALNNTTSKVGDFVWVSNENGFANNYEVLKINSLKFELRNTKTGSAFSVLSSSVFASKENAEFNNFARHCFNILKNFQGENKLTAFLEHTQKTEFRNRFKKEFPEYLI